jgi:hypothetical protein
VLLRWLLTVVAALAVLTGSVTAYAAAGLFGDSVCCCPDPDACKCHDHDVTPDDAPKLKRCSGDAQLVTPHVSAAVVPEPALDVEQRTTIVLDYAESPPPDERYLDIESPPF